MSRKEMIIEEVKKFLDEQFYLRKEENGWIHDIYADYRDELSNSQILRIIQDEYPSAAFECELDEAYSEEIWRCTEDLVEEATDRAMKSFGVLGDDEVDEIRAYVEDNLIVELPRDHYLKQEVRCAIMVDTGDGNYDYTLNSNIYPCYNGVEQGKIDDKASLVWLAKQQGYSKSQLRAAMNDDLENVSNSFLKSCNNELYNLPSHMSTLTFLAKMTVEQLLSVNELVNLQETDGRKYDTRKIPYCGYIVIDKNAETGLFDPWCGGGSLLEIKLDKDVRLPVKYIRSALPDGSDGYSVDGVYGLGGSFYRDVVKEIHYPSQKSYVMKKRNEANR